MTSQFAALVHKSLDAVWRRRFLLMVPILLIVPIGLVCAKIAPKGYVAKTLLLLQESGRDFPLSREPDGSTRMREQVPGLEALLKSDRILEGVMDDILGASKPTEPKEVARWIRDFSNNISMELVGNQFLELHLESDAPAGLGRNLEAVTSRFLDALMTSQDSVVAPDIVLNRRKWQFDVATRELAEFRQGLGTPVPATYESEIAQIPILQEKLNDKERELASVNADLTALQKPDASGGSADTASSKATVSADAENLEKRQLTLSGEVLHLTQSVQTLKQLVETVASQQKRLRQLEARAAATREAYQNYAKRQPSANVGNRGPGILNAPERIQMIDPPRDPVLPKNSSLKIVVVSIFSALFISFGLVLSAELLDSSVRRAEQLEALTGVPVLARLPPQRPDGARVAGSNTKNAPPVLTPRQQPKPSGGFLATRM